MGERTFATGQIRSRGEGRWWLRAYVGRRDGRQQFLHRTVRGSESFARRQLKVLVAEAAEAGEQLRRTKGQTFGDLANDYMRMRGSNLARSTANNTAFIVRKHLARIADSSLESLSARAIETLYQELLDGTATGRPLAASTVRRTHVTVRAICGAGVQWGLLSSNPCDLVQAPTVRRSERPLPVRQQIPDILKLLEEGDKTHRPAPMFALAVRLSCSLGLRRGELCGLRWTDVNWEEGRITIQRSVYMDLDATGKETTSVNETTKTDRSRRTVNLGASSLKALAEAHEHATEGAAMFGVKLGRNAYILSDATDGIEPWRPARLSLRWRRAREWLGLPDVSWHGLRHYVATELLSNRISLVDVAQRLGDSPKTIAMIYGHAIPAQDELAAEIMEPSPCALRLPVAYSQSYGSREAGGHGRGGSREAKPESIGHL